MAVLLIGSTGNGKSCFGNYLLDPREEHIYSGPTFATAKANLPQTETVQIATRRVSTQRGHHLTLTVIDTPGLNESDKEDLRHMIDVIEKLQQANGVIACILVVKFNSKIDAQYRATVQYYSKLLPTLFQRNVIVVMTEYLTDPRTESQRRRQHIDVEQIKRNAISEIMKSGGLLYEPLLFLIDCLPESDEEQQLSLVMRDAIIDYLTCVDVFSVATLHVAKTHFIRSRDDHEISKLRGEITGYNKRLQEANEKIKEALDMTEAIGQKITIQSNIISALESTMEEKDSSDTVAVKSWSVNKDWKFMQKLSEDFDIKSPWNIQSVKRWTNGKCEWKDYVETTNGASGTVKGQFMRGLYASVTINATKRDRYKEDIDGLKRERDSAIAELDQLLRERDEIEKKYEGSAEDIKRLSEFIHERRSEMKELSREYITLDEAKARLIQMSVKE